METSFLKLIEYSIKEHWHLPSLTDYEGAEHNYKDVARWIEKLHILFEEGGIQPGDKVALCSRNTSNWGIAFLATLTYGAVAVPILNEFKPDTIHHIINHSGARLLFVGKSVWDNIDHESMPALDGIIAMADYSVISSRNPVGDLVFHPAPRGTANRGYTLPHGGTGRTGHDQLHIRHHQLAQRRDAPLPQYVVQPPLRP